jgi:hypothetical protein
MKITRSTKCSVRPQKNKDMAMAKRNIYKEELQWKEKVQSGN